MKPEGLDAVANNTMRPGALEAALAKDPDNQARGKQGSVPSRVTSNQCTKDTNSPGKSTPLDEKLDGSGSAAKLVEQVSQGVKDAMYGAIAWAEEKVDKLGSEQDSNGPYTSPATCAPCDLDPIASGVLPAMPTQTPSEKNTEGSKEENGSGEAQ